MGASSIGPRAGATALSSQVERLPERERSASATDDWVCMLDAVAARQRRAVAEARVSMHGDAVDLLQTHVLDCASALEQLHGALRSALRDGHVTIVREPGADRDVARDWP